MYVTFFNHCCISSAAAQKQSIYKISVHGLASCATIDDSHKAKYVHQHTYTIYFTERAHAHTHTHHIFYRKRTHTIYFTGEETLHKTFLGAHTHRKHQPQIQHAKCVRPTFCNHCCVSSAAAQKQRACKCQGMDSLHAQRPMIRTKQSMYISTHAPYLESAPNRVPSNLAAKMQHKKSCR